MGRLFLKPFACRQRDYSQTRLFLYRKEKFLFEFAFFGIKKERPRKGLARKTALRKIFKSFKQIKSRRNEKGDFDPNFKPLSALAAYLHYIKLLSAENTEKLFLRRVYGSYVFRVEIFVSQLPDCPTTKFFRFENPENGRTAARHSRA